MVILMRTCQVILTECGPLSVSVDDTSSYFSMAAISFFFYLHSPQHVRPQKNRVLQFFHVLSPTTQKISRFGVLVFAMISSPR